MNLRAAAFAALCFLLFASTSAASTVRLSVGDRVRVTARSVDNKPMIGRVVYGDPLQLTIALDDSAATNRAIAWESLDALERSEGQGSHWRRGAAYGGALGFTTTSVVVGINDSGGDFGGASLAMIVAGAIGGAALGAGVGALIHTEKWTSLPLDSRVGLLLGAPSTPFAIGIRTSF